jgi:hypothetical protein
VIASGANIFESRDEKKRTYVQLEDDEAEYNVLKIQDWNLIELLESLYRMAVYDSIKETIYFELNMKKYISLIVHKCIDVEKVYAVKLLWQLCFNKKIAESFARELDLCQKLEEYSKNNELFALLRQNSSGCLWQAKQITSSKEKENIKLDTKHIMISYHRDSREMCLKIKKELELHGHRVWIDIEQIHGSSLESMAEAIEQSKCVLMCMSEKYKLSSNCRLEAEYSVQLNKPIVPLIMQKSFKPDGWLGLILGSKIFIDFTKYEFEECFRRLKNEISKLEPVDEASQSLQSQSSNPPLFSRKSGQLTFLAKLIDTKLELPEMLDFTCIEAVTDVFIWKLRTKLMSTASFKLDKIDNILFNGCSNVSIWALHYLNLTKKKTLFDRSSIRVSQIEP